MKYEINNEQKAVLSFSLRVALLMMFISLLIKIIYFSSFSSLLLTPLLVGLGWLLLSFGLVYLVKSSSQEIFALLIFKNSDNEMGDSPNDIFEKTVEQSNNVNFETETEDEYKDLYQAPDINSELEQLDEDSKIEKANELQLSATNVEEKITKDDFKNSQPEEIAKAVSKMLKTD